MEMLPREERGFYESMTLNALRLAGVTTLAAARQQTADLIAKRANKERDEGTVVRFVIRHVDDPATIQRSLAKRAVPANYDKVIILPRSGSETSTMNSLILRMPLIEVPEEEEIPFRDFFLERDIAPRLRERYLVNELGVWRYETAEDVVQVAPGIFRMREYAVPEPLETVIALNREMGENPDRQDFESQKSTNYDD